MHRDIKPNNIIFKSDDLEIFEIALIDFGFSTEMDIIHNSYLRCGTPG